MVSGVHVVRIVQKSEWIALPKFLRVFNIFTSDFFVAPGCISIIALNSPYLLSLPKNIFISDASENSIKIFKTVSIFLSVFQKHPK